MTRPSVRDVAERAGVSVGTVSHVLNHPDRVAQSTLDRVRAAIDASASSTAHRPCGSPSTAMTALSLR